MQIYVVNWTKKSETTPFCYFSFIIPGHRSFTGPFNFMLFLQKNDPKEIVKHMTVATTHDEALFNGLSKKNTELDDKRHECHVFSSNMDIDSILALEGELDVKKLTDFFSHLKNEYEVSSRSTFDHKPVSASSASKFFSPFRTTNLNRTDESYAASGPKPV